MIINDEGTCVQFIAENEEELQWLVDNTESESYQWLGKTLSVDHRYASDIIEGIEADGFPVKQ